jgi:hypothetical protein
MLASGTHAADYRPNRQNVWLLDLVALLRHGHSVGDLRRRTVFGGHSRTQCHSRSVVASAEPRRLGFRKLNVKSRTQLANRLRA